MKKLVFIVAIALIGLGGMMVSGSHAQAAEVAAVSATVAPAQTGLSPQDAAMLKQGLDILKQTLDLLQVKIQATPPPIPNADVINNVLNGLKVTLHSLDSTLAVIGNRSPVAENQTPNLGGETAVTPSSEGSQLSQGAQNQLASVESAFSWKKVIWPALAVIVVIIAALVIWSLRKKTIQEKAENIKQNIQEIKEKSA